MTRDCEDGDDAERGSIADLREEFEEAIAAFEARAAEDSRKRAEGVPVGARTADEPSRDDQFAIARQPRVTTRQAPFNPDPTLLAPHYGEGAGRPIPQRREIVNTDGLEWEAVNTLDSAGVSVTTPDGEPTDVIESGGTYTVECTVENLGGTPARSAVVELFAEHMEPSANVDINEESGKFEVTDISDSGEEQNWSFTLTGTATIAPGSAIIYVLNQGGRTDPPYSGRIELDQVHETSPRPSDVYGPPAHRLFWAIGGTTTTAPPGVSEFTLDLWEASRLDAVGEDAILREVAVTGLNESGIHLATVDGQVVDAENPDENRTIQNRDVEGTVTLGEDSDGDGRRRVGKRQVSVPQNGSRTVSFEYEPDSNRFPNAGLPNTNDERDPGSGRTVTQFHARTYSLATNEVPSDWGRLDHTESRFVARTEVNRRL